MLVTIYNSRTDFYGNRHWAVGLSHLGQALTRGTIGTDNINTIELRKLKIETVYCEMSIRSFNSLTEDWDYFGSSWNDIRPKLLKGKRITKKYMVRILADDGSFASYLDHRNKREWTKKIAEKHASEFTTAHGKNTDVVEAN